MQQRPYLYPILFVTLLLSYGCAIGQISRIGNSPYPATAVPDTLYMISTGSMSTSQQVTVQTLQGLLAKTKSRIMVEAGAPGFRADLQARHQVIYDSTYYTDFSGLVNHFKNNISGYILSYPSDSAIDPAISLCSPLHAIVIAPADSALANLLGIPMVYDMTTGRGAYWAFDSLQTNYSRKILIYQDTLKAYCLTDYGVFSGAYDFYDLNVSSPLCIEAFSHMDTNAAVLGWGSEYPLCSTVSSYGGVLHAADWASNLSTYTNFPSPQQQQHYHDADTTLVPGTHTVCFLMSDGDNVQWLLNDFTTNPSWFASPRRGLYPLGWTVSPSLGELAPTILQYLYDSARATATGGDYFVSAASGMGYIYPSMEPNIDSSAAITARIAHKDDLHIVNVIDNLTIPSFLPYVYLKYLSNPDIDAILYYTYGDNYSGLNGYATCIDGKPLISSRFSLWGGVYSPDQLSATLNQQSKDPYSTAGYSLITVHVWSNNVDSVIKCIQGLDSTVRVVSPEAFVKLFKKGIDCDTTVNGISAINKTTSGISISPNPTEGQINISSTQILSNATIILHDVTGRVVMEKMNQSGANFMLDISAQPAGMYFVEVQQSGISWTQKVVKE